MNTFRKPIESLSKVWGKQKITDKEYRMMHYVLKTECEDGTLLYNVVTGEGVLLSKEENEYVSSLPQKATEVAKELIEGHFLVPVDFDEKRSSDQLRNFARALDRKDSITSYTILPTTSCNARCFYCYEADYPHRTITDETCKKLVDFMEAHCGEHKKVNIQWFGGEPTLCADKISYICKMLRKKKIEYSASMISNGYLFTKELAKTAEKEWKLDHIQITLDGTEETYNKVKSYVGVKDNPYLRVLDNIGYLLDNEIFVSIRLNLDKHNAENLELLINELGERFAERKGFSVYVHTLFDDCGFEKVTHSDEDNSELFEVQTRLEKAIMKFKMPSDNNSLPFLKKNYCMADNKHAVTVNPDGNFGKCEHYVYDHLVGSIEKGVSDIEAVKEWEKYHEWKECFDCPLYPSCYVLKNCANGRSCMAKEREKKIAFNKSKLELNYKYEISKKKEEEDK